MPHEVIMPALGMAQDTGQIVRWLKNPGDPVKTGDALFEVETDKATMEVESPADGYLTDVQAKAGEDVLVGKVIAVISDRAEDGGQSHGPKVAVSPDAEKDALPDGAGVIMPALGMAQDTGLIVAWHKALGDAVASGDILFEVETDKSTMEVEAGHDGYVAALLAEAGQEAPVGNTIAIISNTKPDMPVQRQAQQEPTAKPIANSAAKPVAPKKTVQTSGPSVPKAQAPGARADGRILASPKARRLALEQGLDLARLVQIGHPQPYHVADLEVLKSLPAPGAQAAPQVATRRLTADLPIEGFTDFATWAAGHAGLDDQGALLAGLAAASLGRADAIVAIERLGQTHVYRVPDGPVTATVPAESHITPDLVLRDLRLTRISLVDLGGEEAPVLTLTQTGAGLSITLECASSHLTASQAVSLLSNFAGRVENPLRHLL